MLLVRQAVASIGGFASLISKRSAGHSKWANIKHIKAEKDGERAQLFVKLCQRIKVAIQEGGSANPDHNLYLAQAVDAARKKSMPLPNIQNCIKSAQADKNKQQVVWYEIRGPRGCYIIAQALSESTKRTRDTLSSILRRNGASFADNSGKNLFDHKGIIVATSEANSEVLDKAVDDAIDCGAEEVVPDEVDGQLKFFCEMKDMNIIKTKLQSKKYKIVSAHFDLIPKMKVELTDPEMEAVSKLMDRLEEHPDIVKLYDNIA
uniref:Translational activator of cytochrome c oxidase 1 n=1 Tax=Lygus hesperus TaxID=30085 RepID=A0A0K8SZI8_LYGHE